MTEIAIFPIPGCVTFPHTSIPLHVFEPRYRQMITDCLRDGRHLGVCDVQKEIKPAKPNQALKEALNSNQATYKPELVFSAGPCELIKTLDDGRLHLNVHLEKRYLLKNEVQTLPYMIADCKELEDYELKEPKLREAKEYQEKILNRLRALTANIEELRAILNDEEWLPNDPAIFSFKIFGLVRIDHAHSQRILEMRNPVERLASFLEHLNVLRA